MLGVNRSASAEEIRRAYRRQALLSHPDKHPGDAQAQQCFLEVAEAYAVLSDAQRRTRYDRGGGTDEWTPDIDLNRASELFNANFGQALMRQWQPGLTVRGTLVSQGRLLSVTIRPDGSVGEEEEGKASRLCNYLRTKTTMPGGGEWYTIQFTTTLGERLAALLVPDTIAAMPTWGHAATVAVSWLPTALTVCLVLRVLRGPSRVPGEIPDILAQAFRHLPVD